MSISIQRSSAPTANISTARWSNATGANKSHGKIQLRIGAVLQTFEQRTGIFVVVEVRQKVTATRYRIPDIAVFANEPAEELPSNPPLAAIEILSSDDRIGYVIPK